MDKALQVLQPVKTQFPDLTWADLIVLAGNVALDEASGTQMKFCGGRTDAMDGNGSAMLQMNGDYSAGMAAARMSQTLIGLTDREIVALSARLRSPSQFSRLGYRTTAAPGLLSNLYFVTLLTETWEPATPRTNPQFKARGKELYMVQTDLNLRWDASYLAVAQEFAADNQLFLKEFASAWTKVMNSDRFAGPDGNLCN